LKAELIEQYLIVKFAAMAYFLLYEKTTKMINSSLIRLQGYESVNVATAGVWSG
jgi:hypothetical protein